MMQKPMRSLLSLNGNIWLLAFVVVLFFLNFYTQSFFSRPSGPHQWRQADCLSITKNYYEEGMDFFNPKIHFQGPPEGRAVSECPILNYTVACLWKIFGEYEFIYRLLEYLIFLAAIFVLFNTLNSFFGSSLLAFFSVSVLLTSPLLAYYSASFIADVPALSFCIISICLFYRFYQQKTLKYFYRALFFATLAVLMKASALMGLLLLLFFSLSDIIGITRFSRTEKLFNKKMIPLAAIAFCLAIIISWYRYALHYNEDKSNNIFLLTVLPVWEMGENEIIENLKFLFNVHFPVFFAKPVMFLVFALAVYVMARFSALSNFLKYTFVFSGLFFLAYLVFFFQVFSVHDYYLINLMVFPVVILMCACSLMQQHISEISGRRFLRLFLVFFLIFASFHSAAIYRLRMIEDDKLVYWFPFISKEEGQLAKYLFWDYGIGIKKIENFTPQLRRLGITREKRVISVPDQSFNISLYFLDQKGFTAARHHIMSDSMVLEQVLRRKADYLVLSDRALIIQPAFRRIQHRLESFYNNDTVEVFKIKN